MSSSNPKSSAEQGGRNVSSDDLAETRVPPSGDTSATPIEGKKQKSAAGDITRAAQAQQSGTSQGSGKSRSSSQSGGKKKITQLGDFKLIKKLGQGGMGTVYLATQVSLNRKVALKTLSKELSKKADFVQRFIRESRSMARLHHPNIVQVYAADSSHGIHYAAIEYVDGKSMQDWLDKKKRLSVGDALNVILVCATALKQAHDQNMIHRDIKPDNILVTSKGVVKVADFGLAKALDEDVSMTQSGTGLGTPLYMAPEQARNAKHVDKRSDIYALGSTLYHFLTGKLPFTGETTLELIIAKEKGVFNSARKLNSEISERLDLMIGKMILKDPEHRYSSCDEIIEDLGSLNLANPTLSFIEGAESTMLTGSASPSQVSTAKLPRRSAEKRSSSAEDAERTASKKAPATGSNEEWIVRHTVGKKVVVTKMTAVQIQAGLKGGTLDAKTKLKKGAKDSFALATSFSQFSDLANKRAFHDQEASRSRDTQKLYSKLDKQDLRRKSWRKVFRVFDNIRGFIGLIIWLAVVAGVVWAGFKYGYPYIKDFFQN